MYASDGPRTQINSQIVSPSGNRQLSNYSKLRGQQLVPNPQQLKHQNLMGAMSGTTPTQKGNLPLFAQSHDGNPLSAQVTKMGQSGAQTQGAKVVSSAPQQQKPNQSSNGLHGSITPLNLQHKQSSRNPKPYQSTLHQQQTQGYQSQNSFNNRSNHIGSSQQKSNKQTPGNQNERFRLYNSQQAPSQINTQLAKQSITQDHSPLKTKKQEFLTQSIGQRPGQSPQKPGRTSTAIEGHSKFDFDKKDNKVKRKLTNVPTAGYSSAQPEQSSFRNNPRLPSSAHQSSSNYRSNSKIPSQNGDQKKESGHESRPWSQKSPALIPNSRDKKQFSSSQQRPEVHKPSGETPSTYQTQPASQKGKGLAPPPNIMTKTEATLPGTAQAIGKITPNRRSRNPEIPQSTSQQNQSNTALEHLKQSQINKTISSVANEQEKQKALALLQSSKPSAVIVPSTGGSDEVPKPKTENTEEIRLEPSSPVSSQENPLKNFEKAKYASKTHGLITSYAANTHQGIQRNYNEDRVSIILNMTKPASKSGTSWPKCSYFAIYDGHGGNSCADFLKDHLHQIIIQQDSFPKDPAQALTTGCLEAERKFLMMADKQQPTHDRSGSCAIIVLIVERECFVANVGDSRAIMSADKGKKLFLLSRDHRPNEDYESTRIVSNGGQIYQTQSIQQVQIGGENQPLQQQLVLGPHRVLPGRLSVSRTFGDIEAKLSKYGGKEGVVIAQPEISQFTVRPDFHDFVVLGCDGIFDRLNNQHVLDVTWDTLNGVKSHEIKTNTEQSRRNTVHQVTGKMTDAILKQSAIERSFDNLTVVMISFKNLEDYLNERPQNAHLFQIKEVESRTTSEMTKEKTSVEPSNAPTPKNNTNSMTTHQNLPNQKIGEKPILMKNGADRQSASRKSRNNDRPSSGAGPKKTGGLAVSNSIDPNALRQQKTGGLPSTQSQQPDIPQSMRHSRLQKRSSLVNGNESEKANNVSNQSTVNSSSNMNNQPKFSPLKPQDMLPRLPTTKLSNNNEMKLRQGHLELHGSQFDSKSSSVVNQPHSTVAHGSSHNRASSQQPPAKSSNAATSPAAQQQKQQPQHSNYRIARQTRNKHTHLIPNTNIGPLSTQNAKTINEFAPLTQQNIDLGSSYESLNQMGSRSSKNQRSLALQFNQNQSPRQAVTNAQAARSGSNSHGVAVPSPQGNALFKKKPLKKLVQNSSNFNNGLQQSNTVQIGSSIGQDQRVSNRSPAHISGQSSKHPANSWVIKNNANAQNSLKYSSQQPQQTNQTFQGSRISSQTPKYNQDHKLKLTTQLKVQTNTNQMLRKSTNERPRPKQATTPGTKYKL